MSSSLKACGVVAGIVGVFLLAAACGADPAAAPNPNGLTAGSKCTEGSECQSLTCKAGKCTAVTGGDPTDKVKNGDETDVDCGGSAPKCEDGKSCASGDDCESSICTGSVCKAPSPDDEAKNGDETDVDCGGTKAPKCAVDKTCAKNEDCESDACSYQKKCVAFPSCTQHFGGDTCGAGDTGSGEEKHESCCAVVNDSELGVSVGKYFVTAGRMRAFVERFNGDLQSWASTKPKGWTTSWTAQLPSSMEEALAQLGPNEKRGCSVPERGGRTYWQEAANGDDDETSDFSKDVLDEKALNCVPWVMAQAICHFDGGRLASSAEIQGGILKNHGTTKWPWGNTPNFQFRTQIDQIVHAYSYQTPNPPADMRQDGTFGPLDRAFFVAPPGRRPLGANKLGIQDGVGNVMPWVNDGPNKYSWTASWEDSHAVAGASGAKPLDTWPPSEASFAKLGYWALGARCVFEK